MPARDTLATPDIIELADTGSHTTTMADLDETEHWRQLVYQPLDRDSKEIRVLTLQPSSYHDADPDCTIETVQLASTSFAALSYVWGDPGDQLWMYLENRRVRIGRNAHTALRHLRSVVVPIYIWVDALCINQRDVEVSYTGRRATFATGSHGY